MTFRRFSLADLASPRGVVVVAALLLTFAIAHRASGQGEITYLRGQNIAPAYEGWERNPDGTLSMVFGYLNRNYEEQPDIPIGPNNNIEPNGPDRGQPTHFYPRRERFVFKVPVPQDFGDKELVWTLTVNGKTERAYGTLKPEYKLDPNIVSRHNSGGNGWGPWVDTNKAPIVRIEGPAQRTVEVGEPLSLTAYATDDGVPKAKAAPPGTRMALGYNSALGLRVVWFVHRGPVEKVTFDPEQFKVYHDYEPGGNSPWTPGWMPPPFPADGKVPVKVTFSTPGTFVVRAMVHDGALDNVQEVTVTVNPRSEARK